MEDFDPLDIEQQEQQEQELANADAMRKLAKLQQEEDFKWLMSDQRGRRIVWRLLSDAGVFQTSFNPEAMTMAFKEGQRTAGLQLLAQVHSLCPDLYTTMMKEQLQ